MIKLFVIKIYLSLTCLAFLSCFIPSSICNANLLAWEENFESDLAGYNVYYGTSPGNYTVVVDVGNVTEYSLDNLPEEITYFLAVTAYDTSRNESGFSQEVSFSTDDGIPYYEDNCPNDYNPVQEDTYPPGGNEIGDACECEGDFDCDGDVDGWDVIPFRSDYGRNAFTNPCTNDNPCASDFDCDGDVDGWDGSIYKSDYGRNQFHNPCPACVVEAGCSY